MKISIVKLTSILFFSIAFMLTTCYGQNSRNQRVVESSPRSTHFVPKVNGVVIGDTIKELGKNLMVVYQDKQNNYWFGSWSEGLYRVSGKTIIHYTTKHGLPHNRIDNILEDHSGNLYFNTLGGISKFDGQRFTTLKVVEDNAEWKLEPGDLWFKGAQNAGVVYRYDGQYLYQLKLPKIKLGEDYIAAHPHSEYPGMNFSIYDVYTIYKDVKGYVWFGTGSLGLCRYDGKSIEWITEADVIELHDGPSNGVRSIIEDKEGKFWFSNTLFRYEIKQDKSGLKYKREPGIGSLDGRKDGDLNEYLSAVVDNNGDVWIVTYADGVWRYDGKNIIHYPVMEGNTQINLFSIFKDHQGDLWLGTHESGTYKFNGTTFEKFRP